MTERVIVVGAGAGGLTAAAELAHAGLDVTVLEAAERAGGKLRELRVAGYAIDSGPTVLTMRDVFDDLFDALGTSTDAELTLHEAGLLARHGWEDGSRLDLYADIDASADAIASLAGGTEAAGFRRFSADARRIYEALDTTFMRASRPGVLELCRRFGPAGLSDLFRLQPYSSLWRALGRYFRDPRLQQLFARYAGYCGSSPFAAPATLMLVAHAEQRGVWLVDGGMYRIVDALVAQIDRHGGRVRTNAPVERIVISGGRACGVELRNGEQVPADVVIWNGDNAALADALPDTARAGSPATTPRMARSMSAVTWSLVAETAGWPLVRHNVFFSPDYRREFAEIFSLRRTPERPTVYVCAQDRDDFGNRPLAGPDASTEERLLVIVNAPPDGDAHLPADDEVERCTTTLLERLATFGLTVTHPPDNARITTPGDFHRLFPATGGALYGPASHGWMSAFQRAGSRTAIPGLYRAGGSVHPGPGVPMAVLSGRLAAASVREDLSST